MNFRWQQKCVEIMTHSMEIQKYRNSSHEVLPLLGITLTGNYYCKSSLSNAGPDGENEANFLPLPNKWSIALPPGSLLLKGKQCKHCMYIMCSHSVDT